MDSLYFLYHELRTEDSKYSYVLATSEFERQVDLFVQKRLTPNPGIYPEITFDDGHISNYELALPILHARGLTARFFITVGWTGQRSGYMGWHELQELHKAGQVIGAHGWTHTLLTHCSDDELQTELKSARLTLEDRLGASTTTMSLPGGRYNEHVLGACRDAGYTQIYTSIPKAEPIPAGGIVGRLNILQSMKLEWIAGLLEPGNKDLTGLGRQYRIKATAKRLLGDRMYEKVWALLNGKEPDGDETGATGK